MDLFFVLSGFLITGILVDTAGRPYYYRNFIVRRALRIFPLYYTFLLIWFAFATSTLWKDIPWFATYLGNVHMFLRNAWRRSGCCAALVTSGGRAVLSDISLDCSRNNRKTLTGILAGAAVLALLLRIAFYFGMPQNNFATYTLTPCRMDALAMGGLVALALRANPEKLKHSLVLPLTIISALAFALVWRTNSGALNSTIDYTLIDLTFTGILIW